jgi:hypothetical protein
MRQYFHSALVAMVCAGWLAADSGIANAAGYGRGGCRNGNCRSSSVSRSYGTAKPSASPSTRSVGVPINKHTSISVPQARIASLDRNSTTIQPTSGHALAVQPTSEERKLKHRLAIADRLDQLAAKNGNEHLKETAERMRQKAHAHADNQLAKLDRQFLLEEVEEPTIARSFDRKLFVNALSNASGEDEFESSINNHDNAVRQQLRTEERWLNERLELAERLRELAEQKAAPGLSKAADYLEQGGLNRFEKRAEEIRSFEERHRVAVEG